MNQIEIILVNKQFGLIYSVYSEDNELMLAVSDINTSLVIKQVCISNGKIIDMSLDSTNKHLIVISQD